MNGELRILDEEIIAAHSRLTRDTSGDYHDIASVEGLWEIRFSSHSHDMTGSVDVRQVHSDAWRLRTVIEGESLHESIHLEEERQWLADSS